MMHDFELQLRIRNNHIKARRLELGLSARELGKACGVSYGRVLEYEGLRQSPLGKAKFGLRRGALEWRPSALKLAAFFGATPDELWPAVILAVKQSTITARVDGATMLLAAEANQPAALPSPEDVVEEAETALLVHQALATLSPREEKVLRERFGIGVDSDHSLAEIGHTNGITREAVRIVEARALRKLRHPARSSRFDR